MTEQVTEQDVFETRALASFRTIDALEPIPDADAIELAVLGGWKVVTKKGEFQPGDPCVYFEIDSFLRDGVPAWQFLVDKQPRMFNGVKGHKLRTGRFRGQLSQGLVLKISDFPILKAILAKEYDPAFVDTIDESLRTEFKILRDCVWDEDSPYTPPDLNLNVILGVVKWEPPPLSAQLQGMAEGLFPSDIPKTDEERAQNMVPEILMYDDIVIPANPELNRPEIIRYAKAQRNRRYEISLKCDGSSMTVFARLAENVMVRGGVCSRNLELKVSEANAENAFVKMALESGLLAVLLKLAAEENLEYAVQGELMGPGIQKNREELKQNELYVFNIVDLKTRSKLPPYERRALFKRLVEMGAKIKHAPIPEEDTTLENIGVSTIEELLAYAEGPSIKHPIREGLVFKPIDGGRSFKVISNRYLEKQKD